MEKGLSLPLHFSAFNQLKIMEDFNIFKQILGNRNDKLTHEALKNLKMSQQIKNDEEFEQAIKESLEIQKKNSEQIQKEEEELKEILQLSKREFDLLNEKMKLSHYLEKNENPQIEEKIDINKYQEKNIFKIRSKNNDHHG